MAFGVYAIISGGMGGIVMLDVELWLEIMMCRQVRGGCSGLCLTVNEGDDKECRPSLLHYFTTSLLLSVPKSRLRFSVWEHGGFRVRPVKQTTAHRFGSVPSTGGTWLQRVVRIPQPLVPIRGATRAGEEACMGDAPAWQLGLPRCFCNNSPPLSRPSPTTSHHGTRIRLTAARSRRGMRYWYYLKQRQFLYHSSFVSPRLKGYRYRPVAGILTVASCLEVTARFRSRRAEIFWSI
jgi:hypothetical protein